MDQLLWWLSIGADALALSALAAKRLHRRFPIFTLYLFVNLADDLILKLVPGPATRAYALTWMSSKPIILILWVLVVLELFRLVCEHYPGIGIFARSLLMVVLATASIAAVLSLAPDAKGIDWHRPALQLIVLLNRWVATVLAVFLFAMAGFLHYYNAPIKPNLLRHAYILAGYFSIQAAAMFLTNVNGATAAHASVFAGLFGTDPMSRINRALLTGRIVCSLSWSILLTRTGEELPQSPTISASDLALIERRDRQLLDTVRWLAK
ncbi:MAG TPA: hypothetical protein VIX89_07540 [Bryobacteraceae bacterium]